MAPLHSVLHMVGSWVFRAVNIPAGLALVAIGLFGVFADLQNRTIYHQEARAAVSDRLSLIRVRLEGAIAGDVQLVRGLASVIEARGGIDQPSFEALARRLLSNRTAVRHVAVAPSMIVSMIHPLAGNRPALGLDYQRKASQAVSAMKARATGRLVMAGPQRLVQGGEGLIGRFPIFIRRSDGSMSFWGIVSTVIDVERLYASAGLLDPALGLDIAIVGRDGTGATGELFYGRPDILSAAPITTDIDLPSGTWRLAAIPTGGWPASPPEAWRIPLATALAAILVVLPMLMVGHFYAERRRNMLELARRGVALQRLSSRLEMALDASRVGVWEMDVNSGEVFWDDRTSSFYGLEHRSSPLNYEVWESCVHPGDRARINAEFEAALAGGGRYVTEFRIIRLDGRMRHLREAGAMHVGTDGSRRMIGLNWDITEDVQRNEELSRAKTLAEARSRDLEEARRRFEHASLHDALTGLANRRYLETHLAGLARTGAAGSRVAVLHMDLDRFKQINDTLGHRTGDAMLLHAAAAMRTVFRPDDFVARVGGDEFVGVCVGEDIEDMAAALADRLIEALRQPVFHEGHACRIGVSIGIACADTHQASADTLLIDADIALYRAKSRGKGRYEFYTKALQAEVISTKRIADEILVGLEQGQFIPYYQPQFQAVGHRLIGVEALVRWNHPREGLLTPAAFLRVAEDMNALPAIDRMVMTRALDDQRRWRREGLIAPRVAVNVSLRRLHDEGLVAEMERLAVEPGLLAFELVESIFLDETDPVITGNIERLRQLGIEIEIDDFGTGHASIVSLTRLKPQRLKIDRQLTGAVTVSDGQRQLVKSIIEIGRALDIGIIAEGVETAEQAAVLAELGCDALQGFLFSRPVPAEALERMLAPAPAARIA